MFEATLAQGSVLKKIVDSLKDLVQEVNIEASPSGLALQAMDGAHVSLVSLSLNESGFQDYRCDKPMTLGINLADFAKILKMSQADDVIVLKAEEEDSYLNIIFNNKRTEKTAEFQLNLLTLNSESLGIPDTEYPSYIRMSSSEFVRICQNLTQLTEAVRIDIKDTQAIFSYTGKTGKGKVNLKKNNADKEEDQIDISAEEDVSAQYGLKYLNSFAKASSLSQYVTLYCSSKFPLMIDYKIENLGFVKFFLAPKLDDEADK